LHVRSLNSQTKPVRFLSVSPQAVLKKRQYCADRVSDYGVPGTRYPKWIVPRWCSPYKTDELTGEQMKIY